MTKFDDQMMEIQKKFKDNPTDAEREELNKEFWHTAVEMFNEELAGNIKLADGRTITIPKI